MNHPDTIAAPATPSGAGAIAIVRASGPAAHAILARIFTRADDALREPGRLVLGAIRAAAPPHAEVDRALAVAWKAPASYTGEDMIELHLHGAAPIVDRALAECLAAGARLARAGEFTRRAFENGKLDLAQAEAVCDLIRSQTDAAARSALAQLGGELSRRVGALRASLVPVVAELEAQTDFPEEGLDFSTRARLGAVVDETIRAIDALLRDARRGRVLREGARVVLAGRPNAGKSSLFNALVRAERALVSPHPGTTRDTIEASIELAGIPLTLVDTAGLRAAREEVEALGVERSQRELRIADLVVFVVDPADAGGEAATAYADVRAAEHLVVRAKSDVDAADAGTLPDRFRGPGRRRYLELSTRTGAGLAEFEAALVEHFGGATREETPLVGSRRHAEALASAGSHLATAAEGLASELAPEFIVVDLTAAIRDLDALSGRNSMGEDVLDEIFSRFCLGK